MSPESAPVAPNTRSRAMAWNKPRGAHGRQRPMLRAGRKQGEWRASRNLRLHVVRQWQREKVAQVLAQVLDARTRPVRSPHDAFGDFLDAREVLQEFLGRYSRQFQVDVS